jgi:tetratricopeptide (TPR) repeat protein
MLEMAAKASGTQRISLADRAITNLQISKNKENTPEVNANLALAYLMKGNTNLAALSLAAAGAANPGPEVSKVIKSMNGTLFIRLGQYNAAIDNLSAAVDAPVVAFNRGLAFLLAKNFEAARTSFNEAVNAKPNFALAYYGLAIVGARKGDDAEMARNLSKAVQLDASLKEKAVGDLEFIKYKEKAAFTNAIR